MISLIHPSRSRPQKSFETISKWVERSFHKNFEVIRSLDIDDPDLKKYEPGRLGTYRAIVNENKSAIEAINKAARVAHGDILIVVSDDTDCPPMWDQIILSATEGKKDFVLKTFDGIQKRIVTMPIMDRAYYNRFGYIYHPIYRHSWADTELTDVAEKLGRLIVRNDIKFPHLHPEVTKEPKDALYLRNDKTHDEDRHIYQEWKRINFGL